MYDDPRYPRPGLSTGATVAIALFVAVLAGAASFFVCWTLIAKPSIERLEARVVAAERTRDARDAELASRPLSSPPRAVSPPSSPALGAAAPQANPTPAPTPEPVRVVAPTPAPTVIVREVAAPTPAVQQIAAPELSGLSILDATKRLSEAGLTLGAAVEEHADAPNGQIVGQRPAAGGLVAAGSAVQVTVSKGKDGIDVPYVLEMDMERARRILRKAGLKSRFVEQFHPSLPSGYVFRTRPAARTRAAAGSMVKLYIVE